MVIAIVPLGPAPVCGMHFKHPDGRICGKCKKMIPDELKRVVFDECIRPGCFARSLLDSSTVDEAAFNRLIDAVDAIAAHVSNENSIDRLLVACLFELPWEMENTVEHYEKRSPELGRLVSRMADGLRESIMNLLWRGLESHYEQLG